MNLVVKVEHAGHFYIAAVAAWPAMPGPSVVVQRTPEGEAPDPGVIPDEEVGSWIVGGQPSAELFVQSISDLPGYDYNSGVSSLGTGKLFYQSGYIVVAESQLQELSDMGGLAVVVFTANASGSAEAAASPTVVLIGAEEVAALDTHSYGVGEHEVEFAWEDVLSILAQEGETPPDRPPDTRATWTKKINTREIEFRRALGGQAANGVEAAFLGFAESPNEIVSKDGSFGHLIPRDGSGSPIETGYYGEYAEIYDPVDRRNTAVDILYEPDAWRGVLHYTPSMLPGHPRTAWYDRVMPDFILWINVPGVPDPHAALTASISTTVRELYSDGGSPVEDPELAARYQVALLPLKYFETGALIPEAVAAYIACGPGDVYGSFDVQIECTFEVVLSDDINSKSISFQCVFEEAAV